MLYFSGFLALEWKKITEYLFKMQITQSPTLGNG